MRCAMRRLSVPRQRGQQFADFRLDIRAGAERLGDLGLEQITEPTAEPERRYAHGLPFHAGQFGDLLVILVGGVGQAGGQRVKQAAATPCLLFLAQALKRTAQDRLRPTPGKRLFGTFGAKVGTAERLCVLEIKRDGLLDATPLGRPVVLGLLDDVVAESGEQEGAETATVGAHAGEVVARQQAGEEPLHEILCVGGALAVPTDKGVERRPVGAAKLVERRPGSGPAGGEHEAPLGDGELRPSRWSVGLHFAAGCGNRERKGSPALGVGLAGGAGSEAV